MNISAFSFFFFKLKNTQYKGVWDTLEAVYKRRHEIKTHWLNQLKSSRLVYYNVLYYGTTYKKIDVIFVQCPFKTFLC